MSLAAYVILVFSFFAALGLAVTAAIQLLKGRTRGLNWLEYGHAAVSAGLCAAALILLACLVSGDFALAYVHDHTNRALPAVYRACALWAGQEGSLLVWAAGIALICLIFQRSRVYGHLGDSTRMLFWALHFLVMAFFLLLLVTWSNPFARLIPAPADGLGLNPILRHPGMILHPPLLLLGYAGLALPACLAAAQSLIPRKGTEYAWIMLVRPYILAAWAALTAGIVLGMWWAYMELGWGGYWAWDPVENASLAPWLITTAFLHTSLLERNRQILSRANTLLAGLAFVSTLAATYLTRGGAVDSLHSFGQSSVSAPLLAATLLALALAVAAALAARPPTASGNAPALRGPAQATPPLLSRDGLVCLGVWLLLALAAIILAATFLPAVSSLWLDQPAGLTPEFYNRVCLPLFTALLALIFLAFLREPHGPFPWKRLALWLVFIGAPLAAALGFSHPLSTLAVIFSVATMALGFTCLPRLWSAKASCPLTPAAYGLHLGFALMVLAVAISAPYKLETRAVLAPGQSIDLGGYIFTLQDCRSQVDQAGHRLTETADLLVTGPDNRTAGVLHPAREVSYHTGLAASEAVVLSSLSRDIRAALLTRAGSQAVLSLSIHPLINWLWLGGALMCLASLLRLARHRSYRHGRPQSK